MTNERRAMQSEPVLTPAEITWLLSSHRSASSDIPAETADRLVKLGLMQRQPGGSATINDAGRNWLARHGHLRR